jgi:hypothetical protein
MHKSPYYEKIEQELARRGRPDLDPRHIESYIRLAHSTLDGLNEMQFRKEVTISMDCIKIDGLKNAESCAKSFGL